MSFSSKFILATSLTAAVLGLEGCSDRGRPLSEVTPTLAVQDTGSSEPGQGLFKVTLSHPVNRDVTFDYTTAPNTAFPLTDFSPKSGEGLVPEGETSVIIAVDVLDDTVTEGPENFLVAISHAQGAEILDQSGFCTIAANDGAAATVSFAGQIKPILLNNCISCHGGGTTEAGFSVSTHASLISSGVTGPHVTPFDGANSLLFRITNPVPPSGYQRMPQGGPYLTSVQQQLIKKWIDEGALDN